MANLSTIPSDIYSKPPFDRFDYSTFTQIYFIISGFLTIIANLYIIVLFVLYEKLRQLQCNWLIVYLSAVEVFIGIGTFGRGILILTVIGNNIVKLNFMFCSIPTAIIFATSYRLEQSIALMIAIDRLIAIWKPIWYNNNQNYRICTISLVIILIISSLLIFLIFFQAKEMNIYGLKDITWLTLDQCMTPITYYYFHILPSYSGLISIVFFVVYLTSLFLFWKNIRATKKSQAHAINNLSKIQSRVFVTVSMALFSMTIFYAVPAILQLLGYYFEIDGWIMNVVTNTAYIMIIYGAGFNGILNALIYLLKHQEFRESSKHLLKKFSKKVAHFNNNNTNDRISNKVYVY